RHHLHAGRDPTHARRQAVPHRATAGVHRRTMKILIFGSGGVGGYYGARLQQAGHEVVFVARGAHAAAMRQKGLTIRSAVGDATLPVKVTDAPEPADYAIVAVKLWDTEAAAQ